MSLSSRVALVSALLCLTAFSSPVRANDNAPKSCKANVGTLTTDGTVSVSTKHPASVMLLGSDPEVVTFTIEPELDADGNAVGPSTTKVKLKGLKPSTTYYVYRDNYLNPLQKTSNAKGKLKFKQAIDGPHLVLVQQDPGTITIDHTTCPPGWGCTYFPGAPGVINLARAPHASIINDHIQVVADGITVDLNGSTLNPGRNHGILVVADGVTVQDGAVSGGSSCVFASRTSGLVIQDLQCTGQVRTGGVVLSTAAVTTVRNTRVENSGVAGLVGVRVETLTVDQTVFSDTEFGLDLADGRDVTLVGNTVSNPRTGGILMSVLRDVTLSSNVVMGTQGVTGPNSSGLFCRDCSNLVSLGDRFEGGERYGVFLEGVSQAQLTGLVADDNGTGLMVSSGSTGIVVAGPGTFLRRNSRSGVEVTYNSSVSLGPDVTATLNQVVDVEGQAPTSITKVGTVLCWTASNFSCDEPQPPTIHVDSVTDTIVEGSDATIGITVTDPDDQNIDVVVDWADGNSDQYALGSPSMELAHSYPTPGTYPVTIRVTDPAGNEASVVVPVSVVPPPAAWPAGSELSAQVAPDGSITLNWPAAVNGVAYELTMENRDLLTPPEVMQVSGALSATVAAPPLRDLLRFKVRSDNGGGSFTVTNPSVDVVVDDTPPSFAGTLTFDGDTQNALTISWPPAGEDDAIAGYQVTLDSGGATAQSPVLAGDDLRTFTFSSSIAPDTPYTVSVEAFNRVNCDQYLGACANSATLPGSYTTPAAPAPAWPQWAQLVQVGATSTSATLAWMPGASDATSYRLDYVGDDGVPGSQTGTSGVVATVALDFDNAPYTFSVTAINAQGETLLQETETVVLQDTEPPFWAPSAVISATWLDGTQPADPDTLDVTWSSASDDRGLASYHVQICADAQCSTPICAATVLATASTQYACVSTSIVETSTYHLRVVATDTAGMQSSALWGTATTGSGPPGWSGGAPGVSVTDIGRTGATVSWDEVDQGTPAEAYRVQVAPADAGSSANIVEGEAAGPPFLVDHLTPGTSYIATVDIETVDGSYVLLGVSEAFTTGMGAPAGFEPPTIDLSVPTTTWAIASFLVSGPDAPQFGVAPNAIEKRRAAWVRGRVEDRDGLGLDGVLVSIPQHPEFGATLTRDGGEFDLLVNGGGELLLRFEQDGFYASDRRVRPQWDDTIVLDTVVLVEPDSAVTPVTFGTPVVHAANEVEDDDGKRTARIYVPPGVTSIVPNGFLRATEYTVGENGPASMPAPLPPQSGYTYAVELSLEDANGDVIHNPTFDPPLVLTVDNFLDFPVGWTVPVGVYDREDKVWKATPSGCVVGVTVLAGQEALDFGGCEHGDVPPFVATELLDLYDEGDSFWYTTAAHFSTRDLNWPEQFTQEDNPAPPSAAPKDGGVERSNQTCRTGGASNQCSVNGSVIGLDDATLGESIATSGTGAGLHYDSRRAPGRVWQRTMKFQIASGELAPNLIRIRHTISIAGQLYREDYSSGQFFPNMTREFVWNGKDAFDRPLVGDIPIRSVLTYFYDARFVPGQNFGDTGAAGATAGPGSRSTALVQTSTWNGFVNLYDERSKGLGGWSFGPQHVFSRRTGTLHRGDGSNKTMGGASYQDAEEVGSSCTGGAPLLPFQGAFAVAPDGAFVYPSAGIVRTLAADGVYGAIAGVGALQPPDADLKNITGVELLPDGSLLIADTDNCKVRRFFEGQFETLAGTSSDTCTNDFDDSVDDPLATNIRPVGALRQGPGGNIYFAVQHAIFAITPAGKLRRIVGNGTSACGMGDGGLALNATLGFGANDTLRGRFDVGPDGSIYVADTECGQVRKIGPDGLIDTVAGGGTSLDDGVAATDADLPKIADVAVLPDGALAILESGNNRIRIVRDGIIETFIGNKDGTPACYVDALCLSAAGRHTSMRVDPEGNLLIGGASYNNSACPSGPTYTIERVRPIATRAAGLNDRVVDGSLVHRFDEDGRHLETNHRYSGALAWRFHYDDAGRVKRMEVPDGNDVFITYTANGAKIEPECGDFDAAACPHDTTLTFNDDGYVSEVENWFGTFSAYYQATPFQGGGLLSRLEWPSPPGALEFTEFNYHPTTGVFLDEATAEGTTQALSKPDRTTTTLTSGTLEATDYVSDRNNAFAERTTQTPDGLEWKFTAEPNEGRACYPNGGRSSWEELPDPIWGVTDKYSAVTRLTTADSCSALDEDQRGFVVTRERESTADPDNQFAQNTLTEKVTIKGINDQTPRVFQTSMLKSSLAAYALMASVTSPVGVAATTYTDEAERIRRAEVPGQLAQNVEYRSDGALTKVYAGENPQVNPRIEYSYEPTGFLETVAEFSGPGTVPLRSTHYLDHTPYGAPQEVVDTDGSSTLLSYDHLGRVESITRPGSVDLPHTWTYDDDGRTETYIPAVAPADTELYKRSFEYDNAGRLIKTRRPGNVVTDIVFATGESTADYETLCPGGEYVPVGRWFRSVADDAETLACYDDAGRVSELIRSGSQQLVGTQTSYHENRPATVSWFFDSFDEPFATVGYTWNDFDVLESLTLEGQPTVSHNHDLDGALLSAGLATYGYEPGTRRLKWQRVGAVETVYEYYASGLQEFGRLQSQTTFIDGVAAPFWLVSYTYDLSGRIETITETYADQTSRLTQYAYSDADELESVWINGTLRYYYEYDLNGNRTVADTYADTGLEVSKRGFTYDEQDRITSQTGAFPATYMHTLRGTLASATPQGGVPQQFAHDSWDGLTSADTPGGATVSYAVTSGNQLAERSTTARDERFVYGTSLRPIGWYGADGSLKAQFVYGLASHVPAYMVDGSTGAVSVFVTDHLGSPRFVLDTVSGAVVQKLDYSPYGIVLEGTVGDNAQPFRFVGGIEDAEVGILRIGARAYSPELGQWLSRDSYTFSLAGPNAYAYAYGDPVNYVDPDGNLAVSTGIAIVAFFTIFADHDDGKATGNPPLSLLQVGTAAALSFAPAPLFGWLGKVYSKARGVKKPCPGGGAIPNGTPTFINLGDDAAGQVVGNATKTAGGYRLPGGQLADGTFDFVIQDGQMIVGRGHVALSGGRPVQWAGDVTFSGGRITQWSNASGHFRPHAGFAKNAGLPMETFRPVQFPYMVGKPQGPVLRR